MNVVFVVACDLERKDEQVVLGTETKIACDRANDMLGNRPDLQKTAFVVASAGMAGAKDDHVFMGDLMIKYIVALGNVEVKKAIALHASSFNTDGEAVELAKFVSSNADITHIIICVKWWHAPRTLALVKLRLHEEGVCHVAIELSSCPSHVPRKVRLAEYFGAIPLNAWRIFKRNPLKVFLFVRYLIPHLLRMRTIPF